MSSSGKRTADDVNIFKRPTIDPPKSSSAQASKAWPMICGWRVRVARCGFTLLIAYQQSRIYDVGQVTSKYKAIYQAQKHTNNDRIQSYCLEHFGDHCAASHPLATPALLA